jgi:hypothetical protein
MFKKLSVPATTVAIAATLAFGALAKAESPTDQKASPTPTAQPQNQSIVNTTKSNVKDKATLSSPTPSPKSSKQSKADKGWDGKVQGKQTTSPTASPTPAKSR